MTLSGIDKRWILLSNFGGTDVLNDCIAPLSSFEFVVAILLNYDKDNNGIHKYNVHKNKWTQIMRYPQDELIQVETMAIGQQRHQTMIYFTNLVDGKLMMFDDEAKNLSTVKSNYPVAEDSSMVNINGVFHNIGGDENTEHVAWNSHNDETVIMHDFKEDGYCGILCPSTIYVPSKQMILLIGGDAGLFNKPVGIWKFCLVTQDWKKLEGLQLDYYDV